MTRIITLADLEARAATLSARDQSEVRRLYHSGAIAAAAAYVEERVPEKVTA